MIEIPKNKPKQESADYQPIPSNLGSFMSSVASTAPVEEEPIDSPDPQNPSDIQDESAGGMDGGGINWPADDEEEGSGKKKVSRFAGRKLARLVDNFYACGASFYTHGKMSDYQKTKDELEELAEDFCTWMSETGFSMSPTAALISSIFGMYVLTLPKLKQDKDRNLELEARQRSAEKTARKARNGEAEDVSDTN